MKSKIIDYITKKLRVIKKSAEEKEYLLLISELIPIVLIVLFSIAIGYIVLKFILDKFEVIVLTCAVCFTVYKLSVECHKIKSDERVQVDLFCREKRKVQHEEFLKENYLILRKILYDIVVKYGNGIKLKIPSTLEEIDSRIKIECKKNITYYKFNLMKNGEVNSELLKAILQEYISHILRNSKIEGFEWEFFRNDEGGYPSIMISDVIDKKVCFEVSVVITNQEYCNLLRKREEIAFKELEKLNQEPLDEDF